MTRAAERPRGRFSVRRYPTPVRRGPSLRLFTWRDIQQWGHGDAAVSPWPGPRPTWRLRALPPPWQSSGRLELAVRKRCPICRSPDRPAGRSPSGRACPGAAVSLIAHRSPLLARACLRVRLPKHNSKQQGRPFQLQRTTQRRQVGRKCAGSAGACDVTLFVRVWLPLKGVRA